MPVAQALEIGRSLPSVGLEILAMAQEGLALVSEGKVSDGMRHLDDAVLTAASAEVGDRVVTSTTYCYLTRQAGKCATVAEGLLAAADGDLHGARRRLEDAVALFERTEAPFKTARVRIELAGVLADLGQPAPAGREAAAVVAALHESWAPPPKPSERRPSCTDWKPGP